MATPSHPERIRDSWQPRRLSGAPARAWLIARRTVATLIAIGLLAYCGYLLFSLLWAPKSYFLRLTAGTYAPLHGAPVLYAREDSQAFQKLESAFSVCNIINPFERPLTRRFLEEQLASLSALGMRSKDTLVVSLTAHGVVRDDEPSILCEQGGRSADEDFLPMSEVLAALKRTPAGTKLLILDAGRDAESQPVGSAINTFPKLLEQQVNRLQDPTLWVLSANAALERSHVSPALRQSVLGYMVTKGLGGLADRNGDRTVRLDELYAYVRSGVSAWVDETSGGNDSQSPVLLNCQSGRLATDAPILVSTKWLPDATELNVLEDAEQAASLPSLSESAGSLVALAPPSVQQAAAQKVTAITATPDPIGGEPAAPTSANAGQDSTSNPPGNPAALAAGVNYAGLAQRELESAWQGISRFGAWGDWINPSYVAPPVWRELLDRLLWFENFTAAGVPLDNEVKWRPVIDELKGLNQSLAAYPTQQPGSDTDGNVFRRVQRFAPKLPLTPPPIGSGANGRISFALLEQIANRQQNSPISKELATFVAAYDALLSQGSSTSTDLAKLLDQQKGDIGLANLYEFHLLDLNRDPTLSWQLTRLVLRTRWMGEKVAANRLCGEGWSQETIEDADRLRWEGERLILDRTDPAWAVRSEAQLNSAHSKYEQARQDLSLVRDITEEQNMLLRQLPHYVRWAHRSGRDNGGSARHFATLKGLMSTLKSVNAALSTPSMDALPQLRKLYGQLLEAHKQLDRDLDPSGDAWRIANLLASTLPSPDDRKQLQKSLADAEQERMAMFSIPTSEPGAPLVPALSDQRWNEVREQLELELDFARLAGCDEAVIARLEQVLNDSGRDGWQKLSQARDGLQQLYENVPLTIRSIPESSDLRDAGTRSARLRALRQAKPHWLLLDPQLQEKLDAEANNLAAVLDSASWYDLLQWNSLRFQRAAVDAPLRELDFVRSVADQCRNLAGGIPRQPPIEPSRQPQLAIEATDSISLVAINEARLPFTVRSLTTVGMPIWLVVQYNRELLDVEGPGVSSQDALRAEATEAGRSQPSAKGAAYPYRPDQLGVQATQLAAGSSAANTLKVTRRPGARGTTKIILKAISGESYVRRELEVELPGLEMLQLAVNAGPDFWAATNQGLELRPLPNHLQDFAFSVINREKVSKKLDVSFLIPARAPESEGPIVIPAGTLRAETASTLLEPFKPLTALGPTFPIELPASSEPVRVQLLPTADQKLDPKLNVLAPDPALADKFPGIPLRNGLLVVLKDQQSGELTIRRIEIAPQRPRRYLQAVAHYDQSTDQVQVDVTAVNEVVIPPEGMRVKCRIVEGVSSQREKRLEAEIKSPDFSAHLFAHLQANAPPEVTAVVDVDECPRAFIFHIPRSATSLNIQPADDVMDVRIVEPEPGIAYHAPRDSVPAIVEIDAPEGSFGYTGSTSRAEIGVDTDRDGELRNEQAVVLRSDRQIDVAAKAFSPGGVLKLDTRVGDFHLEIPSTGFSELAADLRGHLVSPLGEKWSNPVEIIFDGAGPSIRAELAPGREVEQGSDLTVRVFTDTADLSGVQTVEAVFDSVEPAKTGDAAAAVPPWEEAKPEGGLRWVAQLKTDKLSLGPHTVLVRATDRVGNKSPVLREEIEVIAKKPVRKLSPEEEQARVANTVVGRVTYYDQQIAGAQVVLESAAGPEIAPVTTSADGGFTFRKIPPGEYTLKSESVIRNRARRGQLQITVPPLPKTLAPVSLKLGQ